MVTTNGVPSGLVATPTSCVANQKPTFIAPTPGVTSTGVADPPYPEMETVKAVVGTDVVFDVVATDADTCSELSIAATNVPGGARLVNAMDASSADVNMAQATFVWPAPSQDPILDDRASDSVVCFYAFDKYANSMAPYMHCIHIQIVAGDARDEQVLMRFGCHMGLLWKPPGLGTTLGRFCFFDKATDFDEDGTIASHCSEAAYAAASWHNAYVSLDECGADVCTATLIVDGVAARQVQTAWGPHDCTKPNDVTGTAASYDIAYPTDPEVTGDFNSSVCPAPAEGDGEEEGEVCAFCACSLRVGSTCTNRYNAFSQFDGLVDEVMVYNATLGAPRIARHMLHLPAAQDSTGFAASEELSNPFVGLSAWYRFNAACGTPSETVGTTSSDDDDVETSRRRLLDASLTSTMDAYAKYEIEDAWRGGKAAAMYANASAPAYVLGAAPWQTPELTSASLALTPDGGTASFAGLGVAVSPFLSCVITSPEVDEHAVAGSVHIRGAASAFPAKTFLGDQSGYIQEHRLSAASGIAATDRQTATVTCDVPDVPLGHYTVGVSNNGGLSMDGVQGSVREGTIVLSSAQYLNVNATDADGALLSGAYTVSLWMNPEYSTEKRLVFGMVSLGQVVTGVYLERGTITAVRDGVAMGAVSEQYISSGWHHVLLTAACNETCNATSASLYVNGELLATSDPPTDAASGSYDVVFVGGVAASLGTPGFEGEIDEILVLGDEVVESDIGKLQFEMPVMQGTPSYVPAWDVIAYLPLNKAVDSQTGSGVEFFGGGDATFEAYTAPWNPAVITALSPDRGTNVAGTEVVVTLEGIPSIALSCIFYDESDASDVEIAYTGAQRITDGAIPVMLASLERPGSAFKVVDASPVATDKLKCTFPAGLQHPGRVHVSVVASMNPVPFVLTPGVFTTEVSAFKCVGDAPPDYGVGEQDYGDVTSYVLRAWVWPEGPEGTVLSIPEGNHIASSIVFTGSRFVYRDSSILTMGAGIDVGVNQWHLVEISVDGDGQGQLRVNGTLSSNFTTASKFASSGARLELCEAGHFTGLLYGIALNGVDVQYSLETGEDIDVEPEMVSPPTQEDLCEGAAVLDALASSVLFTSKSGSEAATGDAVDRFSVTNMATHLPIAFSQTFASMASAAGSDEYTLVVWAKLTMGKTFVTGYEMFTYTSGGALYRGPLSVDASDPEYQMLYDLMHGVATAGFPSTVEGVVDDVHLFSIEMTPCAVESLFYSNTFGVDMLTGMGGSLSIPSSFFFEPFSVSALVWVRNTTTDFALMASDLITLSVESGHWNVSIFAGECGDACDGCLEYREFLSSVPAIQAEWSHIEMTYDGTRTSVYLNGLELDHRTYQGSAFPGTNTTDPVVISLSSSFDGLVHHLRFSSGATSTTGEHLCPTFPLETRDVAVVSFDAPFQAIEQGNSPLLNLNDGLDTLTDLDTLQTVGYHSPRYCYLNIWCNQGVGSSSGQVDLDLSESLTMFDSMGSAELDLLGGQPTFALHSAAVNTSYHDAGLHPESTGVTGVFAIETGESACFVIEAYSACQRRQFHVDTPLGVTFSSADVQASVKDRSSGVYEVCYTSSTCGVHAFDVTYGGAVIKTGAVTVGPGALDLASFTIEASSACANAEQTVQITARDVHGCEVPVSNLTLSVDLVGPSDPVTTVRHAPEISPGAYVATYVPEAEGMYAIQVNSIAPAEGVGVSVSSMVGEKVCTFHCAGYSIQMDGYGGVEFFEQNSMHSPLDLADSSFTIMAWVRRGPQGTQPETAPPPAEAPVLIGARRKLLQTETDEPPSDADHYVFYKGDDLQLGEDIKGYYMGFSSDYGTLKAGVYVPSDHPRGKGQYRTVSTSLGIASMGQVQDMAGDDGWVHTAAVYNGSHFLLFVDGVERGMMEFNTLKYPKPNAYFHPLIVGLNFAGQIDEAVMVQRAMTSDEILGQTLCPMRANALDVDVAAYIPFNDGPGFDTATLYRGMGAKGVGYLDALGVDGRTSYGRTRPGSKVGAQADAALSVVSDPSATIAAGALVPFHAHLKDECGYTYLEDASDLISVTATPFQYDNFKSGVDAFAQAKTLGQEVPMPVTVSQATMANHSCASERVHSVELGTESAYDYRLRFFVGGAEFDVVDVTAEAAAFSPATSSIDFSKFSPNVLGQPSFMLVYLRDAYGNALLSDNHDIQVTTPGQEGLVVTAIKHVGGSSGANWGSELEDYGVFQVDYVTTQPSPLGGYVVTVAVDGQPLADSAVIVTQPPEILTLANHAGPEALDGSDVAATEDGIFVIGGASSSGHYNENVWKLGFEQGRTFHKRRLVQFTGALGDVAVLEINTLSFQPSLPMDCAGIAFVSSEGALLPHYMPTVPGCQSGSTIFYVKGATALTYMYYASDAPSSSSVEAVFGPGSAIGGPSGFEGFTDLAYEGQGALLMGEGGAGSYDYGLTIADGGKYTIQVAFFDAAPGSAAASNHMAVTMTDGATLTLGAGASDAYTLSLAGGSASVSLTQSFGAKTRGWHVLRLSSDGASTVASVDGESRTLKDSSGRDVLLSPATVSLVSSGDVPCLFDALIASNLHTALPATGSTTSESAFYILGMQWSQKAANGTKPLALFGHEVVAHGSDLFVFGGERSGYISGSVYVYSDANGAWRYVRPTGAQPSPRMAYSACKHGDLLYVFGGKDQQGSVLKDLWTFNLRTEQWQDQTPKTLAMDAALNTLTLAGVHGHSAEIVGDRMVVFGGYSAYNGVALGTTAVLDLSTFLWTLGGAGPAPRYRHASITFGSRVYVFGGMDQADAEYSDVWQYDVASQQWEALSFQSPTPLYSGDGGIVYHAAVALADKMISFGGQGLGNLYESTFALQLYTQTTQTTTK